MIEGVFGANCTSVFFKDRDNFLQDSLACSILYTFNKGLRCTSDN